MIVFYILILVFALGLLFWQANLLFVAIFGTPIVYANNKAIFDAYALAGLKRGELVVDLGCGNAKSLIIAAKKFGAKGVGVDLSLYCYLKSRLNVALAGQSKNIKIIWGDFKAAESYLKNADVVYLYLLNSALKKIEPWFFSSISKNTRVVSLAFVFAKYKPVKTAETSNLNKKTFVRLYLK
ncbi:MAG: 50S ribosomal protein L11 methyltransferase [Candidatus Omnitrophica bacterium]|nr:50S ribosomal protein L11 methyltransferase [Candidatus Omnitrophota bacterium]